MNNTNLILKRSISIRILLVISLITIISLVASISASAQDNTWISTGGPEGGIIRSLAISPNYASDGTIFAGTYKGGVFKSTDGGGSWSYSGITTLLVGLLAIYPSPPPPITR